jgi:hypothetical protein
VAYHAIATPGFMSRLQRPAPGALIHHSDSFAIPKSVDNLQKQATFYDLQKVSQQMKVSYASFIEVELFMGVIDPTCAVEKKRKVT